MKLIKKNDFTFNYYNIIYKYSKFYNTKFFFFKYINKGGKFLNLNFLNKKYIRYYKFKNLDLYLSSLGKFKSIKNYINNINKYNTSMNLNFVNFFNKKKKKFVLRIHHDNFSNTKIYKYMYLINIYKNLNFKFHDKMFLNIPLNEYKDYYNNMYLNIKIYINNFLNIKNYLYIFYKILKLYLRNFKFIKNIQNNFFLFKNKLSFNNIGFESKKNIIILNLLKFFFKNDLMYGENLKEFLLNISKFNLKFSDIKFPIFLKQNIILKTSKKKNLNLKFNIFTVYNNNKSVKNKYFRVNNYILSYIKKYFIFFNNIDKDDIKDKKILNNFSDFINFLLFYSKNLLYSFLDKDIDFSYFFEHKIYILDSLVEFDDIDEDDMFDYKNLYKKNSNNIIFFIDKLQSSFKALSFAYYVFKFWKVKITKHNKFKKMNINFLKFKNYGNSLSINYYYNFIFNTLDGKQISNFTEFREKFKFNIYFFKFIYNIKSKNIIDLKFLILNLIFLKNFKKIFIKNLKYKIEYLIKDLKNLEFKLLVYKKFIKKLNLKSIFNIEKIEFPHFKSLNLIKTLKYIEFYREIQKDKNYFKNHKIYSLLYNKKHNFISLYRKKNYSNLKLIRIMFKIFKFLNIKKKKKLLIFSFLNIYMVGLNFCLDSILKKKFKYKKKKKYIIYKEKFEKSYLKKRSAYIKKVNKFLKKKKLYTMEYFQYWIDKKPELLQSIKFNRKIVKYRAEPIYRVTPNHIRPKPFLNKLIWKWIGIRNKLNREARKYFKWEQNFKYL